MNNNIGEVIFIKKEYSFSYKVYGDIKMKYVLNTDKINLLKEYGFIPENRFFVPIWTKKINDKVSLEVVYPNYELFLAYKYDTYTNNGLVEAVETINTLLKQNIIIKVS